MVCGMVRHPAALLGLINGIVDGGPQVVTRLTYRAGTLSEVVVGGGVGLDDRQWW